MKKIRFRSVINTLRRVMAGKHSRRWIKGMGALLVLAQTGAPAELPEILNLALNRPVLLVGDIGFRGEVSRLSPEWVYGDVYRKIFQGERQAGIWANLPGVDGCLEIPRYHPNHYFRLKVWQPEIGFDNLADRAAMVGSGRFSTTTGSAEYGYQNTRIEFGGRLTRSSGKIESQWLIKAFPTSDDLAMRRFFLDWLEPTFGRELGLSTDLKVRSWMIWAGSPGKSHRARVLYRRTAHQLAVSGDYINHTNREELTGPRRIVIPMAGHIQQLQLLYEPEETSRPTLLGALWQFRTTVRIHNRPEIMIDYRDLGQAGLTGSGGFVRLEKQQHEWKIRADLGYGGYDADFMIRTPVLGFVTIAVIPFPISHAVTGRLTDSYSVSAGGGAEWRKPFRGMIHLLGFDYHLTDYYLTFDGSAELEFGLISVPVHDTIHLRGQLAELTYRLEIPRRRWIWSYQFNQLIPVFRRLDSGPVRIHDTIPGYRPVYRGGQQHGVNLTWRWN